MRTQDHMTRHAGTTDLAADSISTDPIKVQRLQAALREAQDTVRSYDTKAQIVGVGYIFAFNIIQSFAGAAPHARAIIQAEPTRILIVWLLVFLPLVMFARVLYPSRGSIGSSAQNVLYAPNASELTVTQFKADVVSCDWLDEISAEIVKVSRLRDMKRRHFIMALWTAAASYALMFVFAAIRSILVVGI